MGCRCKERQGALTRAGQALKADNLKAAAKELQFVAVSSMEDAASTIRAQTNAARARLQARVSRRR
jgi:hypothetical protein